jgi:hypothetical protein
VVWAAGLHLRQVARLFELAGAAVTLRCSEDPLKVSQWLKDDIAAALSSRCAPTTMTRHDSTHTRPNAHLQHARIERNAWWSTCGANSRTTEEGTSHRWPPTTRSDRWSSCSTWPGTPPLFSPSSWRLALLWCPDLCVRLTPQLRTHHRTRTTAHAQPPNDSALALCSRSGAVAVSSRQLVESRPRVPRRHSPPAPSPGRPSARINKINLLKIKYLFKIEI